MLFKHHEDSEDNTKNEKTAEVVASAAPIISEPPEKDTSPAALRELLEKNLKWSQIIYEQNRKINGKLFWTAFANWMRLIILIGSFAAAAYFLPPLLGNVLGQYSSLMEGITDPSSAIKGNSAEDLCKLLPVAQQETCKNLIKKQ